MINGEQTVTSPAAKLINIQCEICDFCGENIQFIGKKKLERPLREGSFGGEGTPALGEAQSSEGLLQNVLSPQ